MQILRKAYQTSFCMFCRRHCHQQVSLLVGYTDGRCEETQVEVNWDLEDTKCFCGWRRSQTESLCPFSDCGLVDIVSGWHSFNRLVRLRSVSVSAILRGWFFNQSSLVIMAWGLTWFCTCGGGGGHICNSQIFLTAEDRCPGEAMRAGSLCGCVCLQNNVNISSFCHPKTICTLLPTYHYHQVQFCQLRIRPWHQSTPCTVPQEWSELNCACECPVSIVQISSHLQVRNPRQFYPHCFHFIPTSFPITIIHSSY